MKNATSPMTPTMLLMVLYSPLAHASDPTGLITLLGLMFVVLPWTLVCFLAFLSIGLRGQYSDRARAVRHAKFGAVGPAIGVALAFVDLIGSGGSSSRFGWMEVAGVIGGMAVAAAFTSLPLWIHHLAHSGRAR